MGLVVDLCICLDPIGTSMHCGPVTKTTLGSRVDIEGSAFQQHTVTELIQGIHWGMRVRSSHMEYACSTGTPTPCSAELSSHCDALSLAVVPLVRPPTRAVPANCLLMPPQPPASALLASSLPCNACRCSPACMRAW